MKRHRLARIVVVVAAVAAVPLPATAQEESWVGQSVMGARPDKITIRVRVGSEEVAYPLANTAVFTVREERAGSVLIHDGHREGWVDKDDLVLVRDAVAYFHRRVRANPQDEWALHMRGVAWAKKGEFDNAIADFNECIRLDPTAAAYFTSRGDAWHAKQEYDRAIQDYDEALRLDPKCVGARFMRSVAWMLMRRRDAADGFRKVLDIGGWRGELSTYAVIVGHLAARQAEDARTAKQLLEDAAGKLDEGWPYPVVKFLRGEVDEQALLALATDTDKRTEARCYLGLDHLLNGRRAEALAHFRWVKERGNPWFMEFLIAVAELKRLEPDVEP